MLNDSLSFLLYQWEALQSLFFKILAWGGEWLGEALRCGTPRASAGVEVLIPNSQLLFMLYSQFENFPFGTKSLPLLSFKMCCVAKKIIYIAATNTIYTKF